MSLVYLDTETTGLDPDRHEVWEIAAIHGPRESVFHPRPNLATADPTALRLTRFYERTQEGPGEYGGWQWEHPDDVAAELARILDSAHIVGAVPSFDAAFLDRFLRRHGQAPAWHYHLIDIEALAVGYLAGKHHGYHDSADWFRQLIRERGWDHPEPSKREPFDPDLPWKSDLLSEWCGVTPPSEEERHTALGDARWVKRWYEAITGGTE